MLKSNSYYMNAISHFAQKWLSSIFKSEHDLLFDADRKCELQTDLITSQEVSWFREQETSKKTSKETSDPSKAACFSLLFMRFLELTLQKQKVCEMGQKPVLTFVTKKGYWLYRVAYHCIQYIDEVFPEGTASKCRKFCEEAVDIKSDRFFTKSLELKKYQERPIVVVDDIVHTGESYKQIRDQLDIKYLTIKCFVAFAITKEPFTQSSINVISKCCLGLEELGMLSIAQVEMFQELGVPYVIDLPILKLETDCETNEDIFFSSGRMTKDTFDRLKNGIKEDGWEEIDTTFSLEKKIYSFFFCFDEDPIKYKFKNLFHNLVIECTYREIGDYVDVTFIPFAIMRSMSLSDLLNLFSTAFNSTEYWNMMFQWIKDRSTTNFCNILITALYRSLVFYFSNYIAVQFNRFLQKFDLSVKLNMDHIDDNWDSCFIESIPTIFPDRELSPTIYSIYEMDDIELSSEYWSAKNNVYIVRSDDDLYYDMYNYFVKAKKSDFCSIENLEAIMSIQCGKQIDDPKYKHSFTRTILQMLNQSAISNTVRLDRKTGYVYRGFRSGENCSLVLPFHHPTVFCAIFEYYMCCKKFAAETETSPATIYKRNYGMFNNTVLDFIIDSGVGTFINSKEASRLLKYFEVEDPSDLESQITNKDYIVKKLDSDKTVEALIAKTLKALVRRLQLK